MSVVVTGNEGMIISNADAESRVNNYSNLGVGIFSEAVKSLMFGKDHIMSLLNQSDCTGIRIYFGIKNTGTELEPELVLVAIDSNGQNIKNAGKILSEGVPCPKICPVHGI